jgi:hypothetical protein
MVARIDAEAATPEGEAAVVKRLHMQYAVSEDSLRAFHGNSGLGYGELAMVYGFVKSSRRGKSAQDVIGMRQSGMEWSAIAKELGVKVDAVATRMRRQVRGPAPAPAK